MAAPAIRGTATTYAATSNNTTHSVGKPSLATTGDYIYSPAVTDDAGVAINVPSGFTKLLGGNVDVSGGATAALARKLWDSGDGSTYDWTLDATERMAIMAFAVQGDGGVHKTSTIASGSSSSATFNGVTNEVDDCLAVAIVWTDGDTSTHGAITDYTKLGEAAAFSGGTVSVHVRTLGSAGSETPGSCTLGISEQWATVFFTIAPEDTGTAHSLTASATAASSTNAADLITAIIVGLVTVSFSARTPGASFEARTPGATFAARKPGATFTT